MTVEYLQIEPTSRCNFTCGFCCGRAMTQSDLAVETFSRALAELPAVRHIELQGEGEPLLHPRFFDMLDDARARGIRVSFITNGSLLSAAAADRILAARVDKVSVSLESADPEVFQAIRGGSFAKVTAGIARLVDERDRRGLPRPLVGLSVTALRSTLGALPAILALYRRLRLDGGITTQPLQSMPAYASGYAPAIAAEALAPAQVDAHYVAFRRATRDIQDSPSGNGGFYGELMASWRPSSRRCPWLDRGLYVDRDGRISPCCMIKDHAIGRIGDPPARVLAARESLRRELAAGRVPSPCRGCQIAHYATMSRLGIATRVATHAVRSAALRVIA